ncbi:MAG: GerMN domain-containing protein [Patescibacteria group bacterium]
MRYLLWIVSCLIVAVGGYWLVQYYYQPDNYSDDTTQDILIYFCKSEPTDIVQVAVDRTIPKTVMVATAAIQELLKGPTEAEKNEGLSTAIAEGTALNYVNIADGVATVDFDDQFDFQMGGSARVQAVYQQIFKTLTQFPTVKDIKITINHGERPAVLEP